jgi:tetratricopeptide (TPR) repeat protein
VRRRNWPAGWGPRPPADDARLDRPALATRPWLAEIECLSEWGVLHPAEREEVEGLLLVARDALGRGDGSIAERALRSCAERFPVLLGVQATLAELLELEGRHEAAEQVLEDALQVQPVALALLGQLARVRRQRGDPSGAEEALQRARLLSPHNPEVLTRLGELYFAAGRKIEALDYLHAAKAAYRQLGRRAPRGES